MPAIIILAIVLALAGLATAVFVAVVLAIHSEPHYRMTAKTQRPLAAIVDRKSVV